MFHCIRRRQKDTRLHASNLNDVTGAPDGTTITTIGPDGVTTTGAPDGTITTMAPDGTTTTVSPDGVTTTVAPNGTVTTMAPDGTTTTVSPDGSTTTATGSGIPYQIPLAKVGEWCSLEGRIHQNVPGCGEVCSDPVTGYRGVKDKNIWGPDVTCDACPGAMWPATRTQVACGGTAANGGTTSAATATGTTTVVPTGTTTVVPTGGATPTPTPAPTTTIDPANDVLGALDNKVHNLSEPANLEVALKKIMEDLEKRVGEDIDTDGVDHVKDAQDKLEEARKKYRKAKEDHKDTKDQISVLEAKLAQLKALEPQQADNQAKAAQAVRDADAAVDTAKANEKDEATKKANHMAALAMLHGVEWKVDQLGKKYVHPGDTTAPVTPVDTTTAGPIIGTTTMAPDGTTTMAPDGTTTMAPNDTTTAPFETTQAA